MDNTSARPNAVVEKLRTLKDKIIPSDEVLWARRKESPRYGLANCERHSANYEAAVFAGALVFYLIGFGIAFWILGGHGLVNNLSIESVAWLLAIIFMSFLAGLAFALFGMLIADVLSGHFYFEKCQDCRAAWLKNEKENWLQPMVDDYPHVCEVFAKRWGAVVSVGLSDKEVGKAVSNSKHDLITLDTIRDIFEFIAREMSGFKVEPLPKDEYGWKHSLITYRGVDVTA